MTTTTTKKRIYLRIAAMANNNNNNNNEKDEMQRTVALVCAYAGVPLVWERARSFTLSFHDGRARSFARECVLVCHGAAAILITFSLHIQNGECSTTNENVYTKRSLTHAHEPTSNSFYTFFFYIISFRSTLKVFLCCSYSCWMGESRPRKKQKQQMQRTQGDALKFFGNFDYL